MSLSPPPIQPLGVRALNAVGGALRGLGLPLLPLNAEALLARAARTTGLSDFGDARFRLPLELLLRSWDEEANLTILGRMIARADVSRLLENRLRMVDVRKRHPEIDEGEIRRPLFIIGLPRTGTTILHELLAQDPANRVPMTWEAMRPFPPPERASYDSDPRIAAVDAELRQVDRLAPAFKSIHAMGALLPQECVALTAHDFATMIYTTAYHIPSYDAWLERADLRWVYAAHRRQLQYLQWHCPTEHWVLKSPAHLWAIDALLATYPDACFVQTHRDPLRVVASLASLLDTLHRLASDTIDVPALAREWTVRLADGLERSMAARNDGRIPADRIYDLPFHAFVGNEVEALRGLYDHFGRTLSDEAAERMRHYLEMNHQGRQGGHHYGFAATGLDPAVERQRYAGYRARFDIVDEPLN